MVRGHAQQAGLHAGRRKGKAGDGGGGGASPKLECPAAAATAVLTATAIAAAPHLRRGKFVRESVKTNANMNS